MPTSDLTSLAKAFVLNLEKIIPRYPLKIVNNLEITNGSFTATVSTNNYLSISGTGMMYSKQNTYGTNYIQYDGSGLSIFNSTSTGYSSLSFANNQLYVGIDGGSYFKANQSEISMYSNSGGVGGFMSCGSNGFAMNTYGTGIISMSSANYLNLGLGSGGQVQLNTSNISSGQTRQIQFPNASGTLALASQIPSDYTKQIVTQTGLAGANTVGATYDFYAVKTPADYSNNLLAQGGSIFELRGNSAVDLPVSWSQISMVQTLPQYKAGSSGGGVHQVAYTDGGGLKYRFGFAGASSWGAWRELAMTGSNLFIDNQYTTLQSASFKIGGDGFINGTMTSSSVVANKVRAATIDTSASAMVINGTSAALPTAYSTAGSVVSIAGGGSWGTVIGCDYSSGNTWFQAQDFTNYPAFYQLLFNPLGGNVGIGVTSASEKLHVSANGLFGGNVKAARMIAGTYDNGGTRLIAHGGSSTGMTLGSSTGTTFAVTGDLGWYGLYFGVNGINGDTWMQSGRTDGNSSTYNILMQQGGGNVGIGVSSASEKLHVNGSIRQTDVTSAMLKVDANGKLVAAVAGTDYITGGNFIQNQISSAQPSSNFWIGGVGVIGTSMGIGTNNPSEKLHVVGSIRQTTVTSSILKADSNGKLVAAVAGTDYVTVNSSAITFSSPAGASFTVSGSSRRGTITMTSNPGLGSGTDFFTMVFGTSFASAPRVLISPRNFDGTASAAFVSLESTTGFTLTSGNSGIFGLPSWNYIIEP
ncbi:MAG: hypothetical protein EOO89_10885 [Pedobacter sp.]|nr:MAG: hypothetical protein EOO89_10885 [Pedobacter sp.]